jgi:hypothetical protein
VEENCLLIIHPANITKPLSKSAAGIEARDISGGYESTFVQVAELPKGVSLGNVKPAIISETIFGSTGKFGCV